jgi:Uma2 family endonuclease
MNPTMVPRGPLAPDDPLMRLPTDRNLPRSDGIPIDSPWHRAAINLLVESIDWHWRGRTDFFAGGDMFVYFCGEHVFHAGFRGPDFFVVKGVDRTKKRLAWVSWHEGNALPNVVIELASPETLELDRGAKKALYAERLRVPEYFVYDPETSTLEGWRLDGSRYAPLTPTGAGRLWSEEFGVQIGPWDGYYQGHVRRWLRFFDLDGGVIGWDAARLRREELERQTLACKQQADAAEAEIARMKAELAALRNPPQP